MIICQMCNTLEVCLCWCVGQRRGSYRSGSRSKASESQICLVSGLVSSKSGGSNSTQLISSILVRALFFYFASWSPLVSTNRICYQQSTLLTQHLACVEYAYISQCWHLSFNKPSISTSVRFSFSALRQPLSSSMQNQQ